MSYEKLPREIEEAVRRDTAAKGGSPFACRDEEAVRRDPGHDRATALRPPFVRDADKILHCPFYNRYADKTQVFSFYKNDDITRRGLHVQLVSRIARTLGRALGLNLELIEAIALGHDIGHTPFGHAGEAILDELLSARTGRRFSHNIHSVRVLDGIFPYNVTLQTLCGIAAHDGEMELAEYRPAPLADFAGFDALMDECNRDKTAVKRLIPSTLEGCVVRICDIIAYLGKDRQDARRTRLTEEGAFAGGALGANNAEIIHNLTVNLVANSYGKPYLKLDEAHFAALQEAKKENYALIYRSEGVRAEIDRTVRPMMAALYDRFLDDLRAGREESPVFTHHIRTVEGAHYGRRTPYAASDPDQIVVDYIASMTDDYFLDCYAHLFPESKLKVEYKGYFE